MKMLFIIQYIKRNVYFILIVSCLIGTIIPLLTILISTEVLYPIPIIDWPNKTSKGYIEFYKRFMLSSMTLLLGLIFFQHKVKDIIEASLQWMEGHTFSKERRLIFIIVLLMIITFPMKLLWGFYFSGISGWTYENYMSKVVQNYHKYNPENIKKIYKNTPFLYQSIVPNNAQFLNKDGFIQGDAIFLHYENNVILPTNYGLTEFVFPQYIFSNLYKDPAQQKLLFSIMKHTLANRKDNKRFILPFPISYPNHAHYMNIDYSEYPDPNLLQNISLWKLVLHIDKNKKTRIVDAHLLLTIPSH